MNHRENKLRVVATSVALAVFLGTTSAARAFELGVVELTGDAVVADVETDIERFHCPFLGPPVLSNDGAPPLFVECSGITEFDEAAGSAALFVRADLNENNLKTEILTAIAVGTDSENFQIGASGVTLALGNDSLTFQRTLPVVEGPGSVEYHLQLQTDLVANAVTHVDFNQTSHDDAHPSTIEQTFEFDATTAPGTGNRVLGISGPVTYGVPQNVNIRLQTLAATLELVGSFALAELRICGFAFRDHLGQPIDDVVVASSSGTVYPLNDCGGGPDPTPTPTATPQPTLTPEPSPTATPGGPVIGYSCTLLPEFEPITCAIERLHTEIGDTVGLTSIESRIFREIGRALRQARTTEILCDQHKSTRTRNSLARLARRLGRFEGLLRKRAARRALSQHSIDDWGTSATGAQDSARALREDIGRIFGLCADLPVIG